ncbi:hypothetical protein FB451DRAFT_1164166 [Mycena latifolia]|nr:hypothetical protein FB451DRAFT_1164166 [Mycena latifolia]
MGGDNKGQGLDAEQSDHLNRMINEDKPRVDEDNMDKDVEIFAWFSDEEFVGGSDIYECDREYAVRSSTCSRPSDYREAGCTQAARILMPTPREFPPGHRCSVQDLANDT